MSIAAAPEEGDGTVWTDFRSTEGTCFWYSTQDPVYNWKSCLIPTVDFGFRSQEMMRMWGTSDWSQVYQVHPVYLSPRGCDEFPASSCQEDVQDGTETGHSFPADSHWCHEQEGTPPAGVCDCPFRGGIRGVLLCSLCLSSKFFSRQLLPEAASCQRNLPFWFQKPYLAFDFLNLKSSFPGLWPILSHFRSLCIDSPVGLLVSLLPVLLASADLATTRIFIVSCRLLIKNTE